MPLATHMLHRALTRGIHEALGTGGGDQRGQAAQRQREQGRLEA